ncbi:MAG TPA: S-layer homology domain-containing protein [Chloroflexia bacterium]
MFAALLLIVSALGLTIKWQSSAGTSPDQGTNSLAEGQGGQPLTIRIGETGDESQELQSLEDYWLTRLTYPTGDFETQWLLDAAKHDENIAERVPYGLITYSAESSNSPLQLNPNSWTSLGPQPLQSNGCQGCFAYGKVSGRVNDIEIDPVTPNVAYIATVGGGVWKTTNCCTAATTWFPVTDDPLISTLSVDDLSIDPNNHETIYVGTGDLNFGSFSMGSIGVLKTTNAGASWAVKGANVFTPYYPQAAGVFPQYQAIGKVEADPNNSNIVVAGTKTGIYMSYNGGDNWTGPCFTNPYTTQRQDITGLILSDAGSFTNMYVAVGARGYSTTVQSNLAENGANGIYKSTIPVSGCPLSWVTTSRGDNGFPAGTSTGVPQYLPNGNQLGRIDMAIAPSDPDVLYAVVQAINPTAIRGAPLGIWRTTDAGATWEQRANAGETTNNDWIGCDDTGQQSWYNQHIEVDPNNPDVIMVDTIDIFKSTNGGDTLTNITCGYTQNTVKQVHVDQHALEYLPGSSSVMLAGNDGGMYVTLNATAEAPAFSQLNDTLNTIEFYAGDITANFANSNAPGANGGSQDNGSMVYVWNSTSPIQTVTPGPAMWQVRNGGDGMYARIEPVFGQRWYQESQNGNLVRSITGPYGQLASASGNFVNDSPRLSFIMPYEIYKGTPDNPNTDCNPSTGCTHLIAGSYRVWETITGAIGGNQGSRWYPNSPDLTKNTLGDRSFINQLSYAVNISTTAVAGTNDGNFWFGFGLGTGITNTATWVNVTMSNTVLPNRPILDVTTDPVNPLIGYAAVGGFDQNTPTTPGHVFRVTCDANCANATWQNKTGTLPNIPVDSIMANPRFPQQVFVGTDWGFYFTDDINAAFPAWHRFQNGMPNVMIWDMSIDRGFTTLAVWTRGRGAYVWPLPTGPQGPAPTETASQTATRTQTPTRTVTSTRTPTITTTSTPVCGVGYTTAAPWATATPRAIDAYGAGAASDGTHLYVGSGYSFSQGGYTNQFARYNPDTDAWTGLSAVPNAGEEIEFVYSPLNNKIYAFGGSNLSSNTVFTDTRIFDIASGNWSSGAPMPVGLHSVAGGYHNGKIYLAGGYTGSLQTSAVNTLYIYDVAGNSWTTGANVPASLGRAAGGVIYGKLYVAGGLDQSTASSNTARTQLYEYNIAANTWATRAAMTTGVYAPGSAVVGNKLWVFGGGITSNPGSTTNITQVYDADANTWSAGPALNQARSFVAGGAVGFDLVAVGGFNGSNASYNTTEVSTAGGVCMDPTATTTATTTRTATTTSTATPVASNTTQASSTAQASNTTAASSTVTRTTTSTVVPSPTAIACTIEFSDVPEGSTFHPFVKCLACKGVLGGYPDGTFRPSNPITRGQIAKIVSNAAGFNEEVSGQTYSDVPPSNEPSSYYVFVERLSARNILGGYPCGSDTDGDGDIDEECDDVSRAFFRPGSFATRGQLSKIVSNAAGFTDTVSGQSFADVPPSTEPSSFYVFVERLAQRHVMGGYPCGSPGEPCTSGNRPYFRPNAQVTRGQAAKIVANTFFPNCNTTQPALTATATMQPASTATMQAIPTDTIEPVATTTPGAPTVSPTPEIVGQ